MKTVLLALVMSLVALLVRPAPARAEQVIPPGQDVLIGEMLCGDRVVGGDCRLASASVESTKIVARYECGGVSRNLELRALGDASADARTQQFAVLFADATPSFRDDVLRCIAAREGEFKWTTTAPPTASNATGEPTGPQAPPLTHSLWFALLWAIPILSLIVAAKRSPGSKRALLISVGVTIVAIAVRFAVPAMPANYYTDLLGPANAVSPTWTPREAGIHGIYRVIAYVVPLSSTGVFAVQRILGSLSAGLLVWAASIAPRDGNLGSRSNHVVASVFGVLFAIDPLEARLAASDAVHVAALFAFAVGAVVYARICVDPAPSRLRLACLAGCALLPGLARVELSLAPLLYPFVLGAWRGRRAPWAFLSIPIAIAIAISLRTSFASSVEIPSVTRISQWIGAQFSNLAPLRDAWISAAISQIAVVGAVVGLVRARRRPFNALMALFASRAIRIASPLAGSASRGALAFARHEIIDAAVLMLMAAWAMEEIVIWVRVRFACRGALVAACAALACWLTIERSQFRREPYTYQSEFEFLARHLPDVDHSCRLVTVWSRGIDGMHFESSLAVPNPMLAYEEPWREWITIAEPADLEGMRRDGCVVYYESSFCRMDPESTRGTGFSGTNEILRRLRPVCEQLSTASRETIAEERVEGKALFWPYAPGHTDISLSLRRLRW